MQRGIEKQDKRNLLLSTVEGTNTLFWTGHTIRTLIVPCRIQHAISQRNDTRIRDTQMDKNTTKIKACI